MVSSIEPQTKRLILSVKYKELILILAVLTLLWWTPPMVVRGGSKPVMVHYMPWFQSPYSLGGPNWGAHWTGNGLFVYHSDQFFYFNPNITNKIASWYYPQIGPSTIR